MIYQRTPVGKGVILSQKNGWTILDNKQLIECFKINNGQ